MLQIFDKFLVPNGNGNGDSSSSSSSTSKLLLEHVRKQKESDSHSPGSPGNGLKRWRFIVSCPTYPGESVAVTGDCDQLGNWKHDQAFLLEKVSSDCDYEIAFSGNRERQDGIWVGEIDLPATQRVKYRYFALMVLDNPNLVRGESHLHIVRRWESNPIPRIIDASNQTPPSDPQSFGFINANVETVETGWLTSESVIQFKISNMPLRFWRKKHQNAKISMKMLALNLARNTSTEFPEVNSVDGQSFTNQRANDSWPLIEVAVVNEDEYQFKPQEQFGRVYKENEILVFQAQVLQLENVAYMIDFYMLNSALGLEEDEIPVHIGFCHILPVNLKSSVGCIIQPITGMKQESIGQIMIEYVVVKPLEGSPCDLSVSYSKHWKWGQWQGLDIGHRGSGNTQHKFKLQQCSNIRENTIASLQKAADRGADFVEFDVQLSKDLVPVLFHDFHVNIGLNRKKKSSSKPNMKDENSRDSTGHGNGNGNGTTTGLGMLTTLRLPMHSLTVAQLHELRVSHENEIPDEDDEEDGVGPGAADDIKYEPFPTLEVALETVSIQTGFNIEVKWPMKFKDGSSELENPVELNTFVDVVLQTVLLHAGKRRIVFSCFHPDICVLLRVKQNKYPVLFLTQGVTNKYPEYNDPRTQTTAVAINFALFAGILGLNMHTEDILRDPNFVQRAISHGLVTFCWGDDNNSADTIKYLKQLGVHGVVYDRIDEHMEQKQSVFLTTDEDNDFLQIASGLSPLQGLASSMVSSSTHTQDDDHDQDHPTSSSASVCLTTA